MTDHYILDGHEVVPCDMMTWARWLEGDIKRRIVKQEHAGDWWISTVFLGLDHQFGDGPALLFETMAFKDGNMAEEDCCERCSTWEQALAQHDKAVKHYRRITAS